MISATLPLEHPILFVCDFSNKGAAIPEYNPSAVVSATSSCASVSTIAEVDGEVTVALTNKLSEEVNKVRIQVFEGTILAPNRRIAVVTAANEKLLEAVVAHDEANVRILVDEEAHPSKIWVEAR